MSEFRPGLGIRIGNLVVTTLLRAGLPIGPMFLLTVNGRRSGLPRTTPVALAPHPRGWRLVAPFGVVDWVKNLRVAGTGLITRGRRTVEVRAIELGAEEAAPLLRESLLEVGPITRSVVGGHFAVALDAPLADWVAEAPLHPAFILEPAD
jgi:deazaflavin-dependent oxidoreductase (nitroreductase family)